MKSLVLIAILLVVLCSGANAMVVKMAMSVDSKNPGMCTIDNMIIKQGDSIQNPHGQCAILTCFSNGQTSLRECQKQGMRDGCKETSVINPNALYPECCKRYIECDEGYYSKFNN